MNKIILLSLAIISICVIGGVKYFSSTFSKLVVAKEKEKSENKNKAKAPVYLLDDKEPNDGSGFLNPDSHHHVPKHHEEYNQEGDLFQ